MKNELKKIAERVSQKLLPNVSQEELYKEITKALQKINDIGYNPANKDYQSQITKVREFFKKAKEAYEFERVKKSDEKKDFSSFKTSARQANKELWKIVNSQDDEEERE